jgi:hypothetical protein
MFGITVRQLKKSLFSGLFVVAFASPILAQGFLFGLKAGIPITEYFHTGFLDTRNSGGIQYSAATRRYTIGFSAERRLIGGLGFEVNVKYQRMGYVHDENFFSSVSGVGGTIKFDVTGGSWDFPIMMKYRFFRSQRPYVLGGFVIRHIGPVRARGTSILSEPFPTRHTVTTQIDTGDTDLGDKRNFSGLTVGAGFEFGGGRLRFSPELRYSHWSSEVEFMPDALRMNSYQLEILLGIVFGRR